MSYILITALLFAASVCSAGDLTPSHTKRFICPTDQFKTQKSKNRLKYVPDFIHFRLMGEDLNDLIDFAKTYNFQKTYIPNDVVDSINDNCEFGNERRGKDTAEAN